MLAGDMRGPRSLIRAGAVTTVAIFALAACGGSGSSTSAPSDAVPSSVSAAQTEAASVPVSTDPLPPATLAASTAPSRPPKTIRVPADSPTIQSAVDLSVTGDLLLIWPGTYREAVEVRTPGITLRGVDRNTVVLDGGDELENGVLVAADGVAVENLTVRRYTFNGVLFTKAYDDNVDDPTKHVLLEGYRASYLTLSNNGQYGVYAFFARGGRMDHLYASGHPDSGVYVGQCKPCDAVLTDIVAEQNSIGYEGTNAGGNLFVVNSIWRNNRIWSGLPRNPMWSSRAISSSRTTAPRHPRPQPVDSVSGSPSLEARATKWFGTW
jgi:hypothetical protein